MSAIKLIYFDGCPNAKHARAALLTAGAYDFEVIKQNELAEDHRFKRYSSPTILKDEQIIFGSDSGNASCSFEGVDPQAIKSKLDGNFEKKGVLASVGSLGSSLVVGLCPLCIPAIGAFLSSVGLGFLVQETVLKPLLIALLAVTLLALAWSYFKEHGKLGPLALGVVAAGAMYVGRYVYLGSSVNLFLMYGSIPALVAITFWNLRLRRSKKCSSCKTT